MEEVDKNKVKKLIISGLTKKEAVCHLKRAREYEEPTISAKKSAKPAHELMILHKSHPLTKITEERISEIMKELNTQLNDADCSVGFEKSFIDDGKIKFLCVDRKSFDWLKKKVEDLDKDKNLVVAEEFSASERKYITLKLADPKATFPMIKKRIKAQNQDVGIETDGWQEVSQKYHADGDSIFCICVDKESYEKIKTCQFRILFGFGKIFVKTVNNITKVGLEDINIEKISIDEPNASKNQ